jgi:uncharacterized protein
VEITDSFTVASSPDQVWELFLDVERVAPCMPGAELTEVIDDKTWAGRVRMKIGPVSMKYSGRVAMVERDDAARRMTLRADGSEESGKGGATAEVRVAVDETPEGGAHVVITQDLALSGAAAQFGGRMIADVSAHLTKQFAACLNAQLAGEAVDTQAKAVPALRLAVWAFFRAVGRALRLPWGRAKNAEG